MTAFQLMLATLTLLLGTEVFCLPGGAPSAACPGLAPSSSAVAHMVGPQLDSTRPYILGGFNAVFAAPGGGLGYVPGMTYRFTVTSENGQTPFRGVLLQGRSMATDDALGTFNNIDGNTRRSSCSNAESGITHNSRSDKESVDLEWVAPPAGSGPVVMGWTVVQTLEVYWANIRSGPLIELPAPTVATTEAPTMNPEATTMAGTMQTTGDVDTTSEGVGTTTTEAAEENVTDSGTTFSSGLIVLLTGLMMATMAARI